MSGSLPESGAKGSDLGVFGKGKRVFHIDPEIAHGVLYLAMGEKNLASPQVAGRPVDDRCLRRLSEWVPYPLRIRPTPFTHSSTGEHTAVCSMPIVIDPAGKNLVAHRTASAFEPCQQAGPIKRRTRGSSYVGRARTGMIVWCRLASGWFCP